MHILPAVHHPKEDTIVGLTRRNSENFVICAHGSCHHSKLKTNVVVAIVVVSVFVALFIFVWIRQTKKKKRIAAQQACQARDSNARARQAWSQRYAFYAVAELPRSGVLPPQLRPVSPIWETRARDRDSPRINSLSSSRLSSTPTLVPLFPLPDSFPDPSPDPSPPPSPSPSTATPPPEYDEAVTRSLSAYSASNTRSPPPSYHTINMRTIPRRSIRSLIP